MNEVRVQSTSRDLNIISKMKHPISMKKKFNKKLRKMISKDESRSFQTILKRQQQLSEWFVWFLNRKNTKSNQLWISRRQNDTKKNIKISKLMKRFLLVQHEQTNIIETDETHNFVLIALSTANKLKYVGCQQRKYYWNKMFATCI